MSPLWCHHPQVQWFHGAEHVVEARETILAATAETQSATDGEGKTHTHTQTTQKPGCFVFSGPCACPHLYLFQSFLYSSLSSCPVVLFQQRHRFHHVTEHHHCHFKYGWVVLFIYICVMYITLRLYDILYIIGDLWIDFKIQRPPTGHRSQLNV